MRIKAGVHVVPGSDSQRVGNNEEEEEKEDGDVVTAKQTT